MDEFDDDDSFGALPDDTLQQLEQAAISSTQTSTTRSFAAQQPPRVRTYGTTGLSRTHAARRNHWRPPQPRQQQPTPRPQIRSAPPAGAPAPPSSDYGFDDEDVIDLDEPSMVIQSTSALPTRARTEPSSRPPPPARFASKPPFDPETEAAFAAADAELGAHNPAQWAQPPHPTTTSGTDISTLQTRIAHLEAENTALQHSASAAHHTAQQKQGEIAIVRANQQKSCKEYERRIAVLQKLHADESARQKAEVEMGRRERERLETEGRFLVHEFGEVERARRKEGGMGRGGTPRKNKSMRAAVLGDGFEDEEVRMSSPSRSKDRERERERDRDRSGEQTPKAGNKRKRAAVRDSPVPALSFSGPVVVPAREESEQMVVNEIEVQGLGSVREEDDRYEFMQKLLHHRPHEGHGRSIESLTKYAFPSDTGRSLSSLLLDGLSSRLIPDSEPLQLKLSHVSLKLWSRCLQESYYTPIYLLLDLIRFALALERASTVAQFVPPAVPLCIRTIESVASPTARAFLYPSFASSTEYQKIQDQIGQHIDVDELLDFLQRLCDAAVLDHESCEVFWGSVEFPFMLLMLNKAQPISQILTALRILATSALSTTFGPICPSGDHVTMGGEDAEKQAKQERDMLDRLTNLLFEMPVAPEEEPAYSEEEIQELRIEILAVLKALCLTDHGSLLLAQHRSAIGRLVRFLDGQIFKLYTTRPSLGLAPKEQGDNTTEPHQHQHPHDLLAETINTTVRLLYHLLSPSSNPNTNINLIEKFNAVRGGYHKFLTSFTRLAFSDQLVLEAGIEGEVVEAAHRVLDGVLSPEEGEAVMMAVETPRGTGGRGWEGVEKNMEESLGSEGGDGDGQGEGEGEVGGGAEMEGMVEEPG